MSINISGYSFSGPFSSTSSLEDKSGVYAILTHTSGENYNILDVGESSTVKERVENHDRKSCWQRNAVNGIQYAVHYTPGVHQSGRMKIEQRIRNQYNLLCGSR